MAIRVQQNSEDFGRCGCGRRQYCDGSHGLSEAQWQARLAAERGEAVAQDNRQEEETAGEENSASR